MQTNLDGHVPTISARAQSWLAGAAKKMLIDGKWVAAASGETFDTVDPGNGSVLARVSRGASSDIDAAVRAARRAFGIRHCRSAATSSPAGAVNQARWPCRTTWRPRAYAW